MTTTKQPSLLDALTPLIVLAIFLSSSVFLFGDNSSFGANQIALILSACIAGFIGMKNGFTWKQIEEGMVHGISLAMGAILILLAVGSLIGTWILAGTVPTLIYYGLQVLDPSIFYAASCLLCGVIALCIGSSWTVAGTLGIGLMGVAVGLNMDPAITAGAVISGAYFGDKMSPLSETTNMASGVSGSDLFDHIKHMTYTSVPAFIFALIVFALLGLDNEAASAAQVEERLKVIEANFYVGPGLLIPLALLLFMAFKKIPAFLTVLTGALVGGVWAILFQSDVVKAFAASPDLPSYLQQIKGVWTALFDGFKSATGNEEIDALLTRGGMSSMLNTVWLVLTALTFGGVMEKTGLLQTLINHLVKTTASVGTLLTSTMATAFGINIAAADQYMAVVLPGRMFKSEFDKRNLESVNLSRAIEDSGTVTSALIPWNTCGAYMAGTLGVSTLAYLPYAVFNWAMPLIAIVFAYTGFKVLYKSKQA